MIPSRMMNGHMSQSHQEGDVDDEEPLDDEGIIERIERARELLGEVRDKSDIPTIAHTAHQADVLFHGMLWELGAEETTAPETREE